MSYSIKTLSDGRFALMNSRTNSHSDMPEFVSPDRLTVERMFMQARMAELKSRPQPHRFRGEADLDAMG